MVPTKDIDCSLHIKAIETIPGKIQRRVRFNFRRFTMKGFMDANSTKFSCKNAHFSLFKTTIEGDITETKYWKRCGDDLPQPVRTRSQSLLLRIVVMAPEWAKANANGRNFIRKGTDFVLRNDTLFGPMVDFTFDFTSYFEGKRLMRVNNFEGGGG